MQNLEKNTRQKTCGEGMSEVCRQPAGLESDLSPSEILQMLKALLKLVA